MQDIKFTPLLDTLKLQKIDDEEYFSVKYKNYVSNSRMGLIYDWDKQEITSDKFFEGFKSGYNPSFELGSLVHMGILQPELFNIVESVDKPSGKMGVMADLLYKICPNTDPTEEDVVKVATEADYYKGVVTSSRLKDILDKFKNYRDARNLYLQTRRESLKSDLYFDQRTRETGLQCIRAIENNKFIQKILKPEVDKELSLEPDFATEQAILLDLKVNVPNEQPFILKLKAKLDHYVIDTLNNEIQVNDLKTIGRPVNYMMDNIQKFHYNREFAFYAFLLSLVAKKYYNLDKPKVSGNYLCVSTIPNFYTKVVPCTPQMFKEGWKEVRFLIRIIAQEICKGHRNFVEWL